MLAEIQTNEEKYFIFKNFVDKYFKKYIFKNTTNISNITKYF